MGRSRALSLTILTYAVFTGLSFFAQTWWQLMIFRFIAALGIGGEWAVGSALLSETWPKAWRPWIAAVLQTGVCIGVLLACVVVWSVAAFSAQMGVTFQPRWVFLAGVAPAFIVYWIRKNVPEPEVWKEAKRQAVGRTPGFGDLFSAGIRRTTIFTIVVCALSLSGSWAFMFWHLRTTGAGFCYNIGRIAAAAGTVIFGLFAKVGDFRLTLLCSSYLFIGGIVGTVFLSEPPAEESVATAS